jgi:subtilisin
VDSGVDYTHPDLMNNIWVNSKEIAGNGLDDDNNGYIDDRVGWDYVDYDNTPLDLTGHGTHIAGTIAAELNTFGATGVAYGAKVMPVRVLDTNGNGSYARIAEGVYYAVNNGANIINLSIGGSTYSAQLQAAIQYATDRGVLVISAAGNNGGVSPLFPASLASQVGVAVGAVDRYNQMPRFSARSGATPVSYVVAPGVDIFSTIPNNGYGFSTGTSMAVPHMAGVAALLLSANRTLTPAQLTALLTRTANPTGITVPILA